MSAETCRVTLVGPRGERPRSSLMRLGPWTRSEWRRMVIEFEVGGDDCPDAAAMKIRLQAIQDLIKFNDGKLTDTVVDTIRMHLTVVSLESFKGP